MWNNNHFYIVCQFDNCIETWPSEEERVQHEHDNHLYCYDCNRTFMNSNNLRMVWLILPALIFVIPEC